MEFIVIEKFGTPTIVTDENGDVKIFDDFEEAGEETNDCQDGIVVPLD